MKVHFFAYRKIFSGRFFAHTVSMVFLCMIAVSGLFAQPGGFNDFYDNWPFATGDSAIAEKYLLWVEDAIAAGHWSEAKAALERAGDFANVSSDISYLLARVRFHENDNLNLVLQALGRAIGTNRWAHYSEVQARLFQAEQLIVLRRYSAALDSLAIVRAANGETIDLALLRLTALKGMVNDAALLNSLMADNPQAVPPVQAEFRRYMLDTLNRYPRDSRPLRILFNYALSNSPKGDDLVLMELALNRLPFLLDADPELAWMAVPFIGDVAEARRLLGAYRAGSYGSRQGVNFLPNPASIVPALNLGLLDEMDAVEELFFPNGPLVIDKELVNNLGKLLRSEGGRDSLALKLHSFTGSITADENLDGYPESRAIYQQGNLKEYFYDAEQDGSSSLLIQFVSGSPQQAELATMPAVLPGNGGGKALITWEQYPSVLRVELGTEIYLYAPRGFNFAPIDFIELGATNNYAGLLYPQRSLRYQTINRHMLASFAVSVQRPSVEFEGGIEHIYLSNGIPIRAEDMLNGQVVSVTEFENGRPVVRRLDMDLDGRMETVRYFNVSDGQGGLMSSESDWSGDGTFSTSELYQEDGSVVYTFDVDGCGIQMKSEK
jgi:hypothetical protein